MERDIEKDLIEIECAIKSQKEKDNIFTMSVLQRCYKLVSQLKEYKDLEEQGKLMKLPCAVGDTVYYLDRFCSGTSLDCPRRPCEPCEYYKLEIYEGKFKLNDINDFGKTVFLTREEAEAALKELERGKGE